MIGRLIAFTAAAIIALALSAAEPADACTGMPELNAIKSSDLIVAGRVTGWDIANDIESRYGEAVRIHVAVDETFKGDPRNQVDVVTLVDTQTREGHFVGGSDCSAFFGYDPTGYYYVLGLVRRGGDYYAESQGNVMFSGEAPAGEAFRLGLRDRIAAQGSDGESPAVIGVVLIGLFAGLAACTAAWLAVRRRTST